MTDENAAYPKSHSGKPVALEPREASSDGRLFSPSTGRNKDIVREVFLRSMPMSGHILEIASGTGEHGAHITMAAQDLSWTYSDINDESMASQAAWADHVDHDRLKGPLRIDMTTDWTSHLTQFDGIFCANMIHIAPFEAARGLMRGAGQILPRGGQLFLYGPFARHGQIAPSNQAFTDDLKRRDPRWGVRDLELDLLPIAGEAGLYLVKTIDMPANNLAVIFQRS